MAKVTIFKKKSMKSDMSVGGLKYVEVPDMDFEVEADIDSKVFDQVKKDAVLLQEMNDEVKAIYKQTAATIEKKLDAFDGLIVKMVDGGAPKADIERQLDGLNKAIEKDHDLAVKTATKEVEKLWQDIGKKKKEYLGYRIKIGCSIVGSVASLATSIGLIVTAPFTAGVGVVLGMASISKALVQIGKELVSAYQTVDQSLALLIKQLDILEKVAKTNAGRKANEWTGAIATQILGIAQPTIKSAKSHAETVQAKLQPIEEGLHDAGKELNNLLDAQEKFRKEFMEGASKRLYKHPSDKAKGHLRDIENRLDKFLVDSRAGVEDQIAIVEKLGKDFRPLAATIKEKVAQIDKLAAERDVDERWIRFVLNLCDLGGSVTVACTEGGKAAGEIVNAVVPWVSTFVYESVSTKLVVKTLLEES